MMINYQYSCGIRFAMLAMRTALLHSCLTLHLPTLSCHLRRFGFVGVDTFVIYRTPSRFFPRSHYRCFQKRVPVWRTPRVKRQNGRQGEFLSFFAFDLLTIVGLFCRLICWWRFGCALYPSNAMPCAYSFRTAERRCLRRRGGWPICRRSESSKQPVLMLRSG